MKYIYAMTFLNLCPMIEKVFSQSGFRNLNNQASGQWMKSTDTQW